MPHNTTDTSDAALYCHYDDGGFLFLADATNSDAWIAAESSVTARP